MSELTNFQKVIEFHNCAGHPVNHSPVRDIFTQKPERVKLRLGLIQEEVKELEQAVKDKNFVEVIDALTDIIYVVNGMGIEFGIDLDKSFDIVHKSNMTKFCSTEEEAQKTVEWYKTQYQNGLLPYKSPCYRRSPDGVHWVVYNSDNDKALKSINYTPANFDELLN
jgi:predicted HAD superfamily Cof-like phosphohydrolase